jgi:hypothetical protein
MHTNIEMPFGGDSFPCSFNAFQFNKVYIRKFFEESGTSIDLQSQDLDQNLYTELGFDRMTAPCMMVALLARVLSMGMIPSLTSSFLYLFRALLGTLSNKKKRVQERLEK